MAGDNGGLCHRKGAEAVNDALQHVGGDAEGGRDGGESRHDDEAPR